MFYVLTIVLLIFVPNAILSIVDHFKEKFSQKEGVLFIWFSPMQVVLLILATYLMSFYVIAIIGGLIELDLYAPIIYVHLSILFICLFIIVSAVFVSHCIHNNRIKLSSLFVDKYIEVENIKKIHIGFKLIKSRSRNIEPSEISYKMELMNGKKIRIQGNMNSDVFSQLNMFDKSLPETIEYVKEKDFYYKGFHKMNKGSRAITSRRLGINK